MRLAAWILVCAVWYFAPYHVAAANTEFITVWQTTADNESITIPTHSESIYNYTVDWGDSNTNVGQTGDATHSYAIAGTHRVSITGDFPRIYFNDAGDNEKIISIEQWGNIAWSSMENAFEGCANLLYDADDMPNLSSVTSTAGMFRNADFFNGDIGLWNVSAVTNMAGMFDSATSFNQNLNSWDVSQVTDMSEMFLFAAEFKGDISGWKVGQVTDMSGMFLDTTEFNGDISEWDVSQVTNMSEMFLFATEFNSDISGWKVGQVTDMSNMFESAESFNQNLSLWDVSAVTDMSSMFSGANEFNGDISGWEVGQVTGMSNMFFNATLFNGKISQWDVSKVTDMSNMFFDVTLSTETYDALLVGWSTIDDDESSLRSTVNFHAGNSQFCNTKAKGTLVNTPNDWTITDGGQADNCPRDTEAFITTWRTTTDNESITIPTHSGSIYNYNVDWGDSNISFRQTGDVTYSYAIAGTHRVSITGDFPRIYFNGTGDNEKIISIEQWGPIAWSSMENAFEGCVNLRYNAADRPNLSSVTSTAGMFRDAVVFNGNIGLWDVSTVTNMAGMFDSATSFNQNLNSWDVSQVTDMSEMFLFATEFKGDISGWKVGQVTDMSGMFVDATQFNGDISQWNVSQVTDMYEMFLFATEFNSDISRWKVGQVTDMSNMFESAESFNQNLSLWDVSAVTDMSSMFLDADEFNGDISGWEVGQVTDMNNMFNSATSFNQGIGNWNVSQVTNMSNMFSDVTLSTENYDALLVGWSTIDDDESSLRSTVSFDAGSSRYCNQAARNILIGTYSWMITDGNRDTDGNCLIPELTKEIADQDIFANTEFGYTFSEDTFHSPSNSSLIYTVNKSPSAEWLNFNAETRTFSGTPSADDIGMITITVTATDSNGNSASGTFTITVPNRPPVVMAGLTPQTATVGNLFEYRIPDDAFSDPDGGPLSYQTEGQPGWLNFSTRTRIFSGTPTSREDIGISTVTITATDQFNSSASGTFTITVPNRPPTVMAGFTPQMATLDELFEYPIPDGMFSDPDGGPLSYTATGQPGWLNFSTRTRIFSGTPGSTNDIGISTITVTVTDLNGGNLVSTFTVTVPNQPPVVAAGLVNQSAVINTAFSYSIDGTFSDPDRGTLSYTATGQPGWLNFSTINNTFSGTPTNTNDIGISTITVTVADHLGAISTDNFTLTVVQVNMPTTLTMALENRTAYAGELFMYDIEGFFSDPDGGPLSYTATGQPGWLNFSTRTRIFSGTPTSREDIGISTVTITATDQFNSSASGTFTITVPNRPPVVAAGLTSQTATVGNLFEYPIPDGAFSDPDGGPLSYTATGRPEWLDFSTRTRIFSGTPGSTNDIGVSTITVTVTDLNGGILVSPFTVTVSNSFITIWRTTADNESITIPTHSESTYNYTVDWGDNDISVGQTGDATHSYAVAGTHRVSITGDFPRIYFNDAGDKDKIISIEQWGNIAWSSMESAFAGCTNLRYNATDRPDLSRVTSTAGMFRNAVVFNGNIGLWDVSQVTDMAGMFNNASSFNQNLSLWDVSQVIDMSGMFSDATEFNGDISGWEVGQVTDMNNMFNNATSFNQGIGNWNVSQVADMEDMFVNVTLSTENYDALLSGWSTIDDDESSLRSTVNFNAGSSRYCNQAAKNILTGTYSWMITDGNRDTDGNCLIPELANEIADQDIFAGTEFNYTFPEDTFHSPRNDTLTYTVNVSPSAEWLNFSSEARTFSGIPSADDIGVIITITVTATDANGNSAEDIFTLTTVLNQPPVVAAGFVNQSAVINTPFSYSIDGTFSDPDGGRLSYTATGRPEWLSFSTINNTFSGTPTSTNDIGISTVTVTATDQLNSSASGTFTITVPNRPPVTMAGLTSQTATVGNLFEYRIPDDAFSDPDGGLLSYRATEQPDWLNFSTKTRIFSGTPTRTAHIGISTITVTVTDLNGGSLISTFTLTVPNRPPVVAAGLTSQRATVGNLFEYPIPDGAFSDPDGGRLSYTAAGQPEWLNFSTISNTFSGTPTRTTDIGISTITVTVTDLNGGNLVSTFTVTVLNRPPVVAAGLVNQSAVINTPFSYSIDGAFSDPDDGLLSYTATGQPRWLDFLTIDNTFSGTPGSTNDIGISTITVTVTDLNDGSLVSTFTITVPNRPPVVAAGLVNQSAIISIPFSYPIDGAFSDPDGGLLSYAATGRPDWLDFSTINNTFSGTPTRTTDIGISTITVTVTDLNDGSLVSTFTITVPNRPPVVAAGLVNQSVIISIPFSYPIDGAFSDPDGGLLSYAATGQPDWLDFSTINNTFSGTPTRTTDIGISTITVTVADHLGAISTDNFTLTVVQVNMPTTLTMALENHTAYVGELFMYDIEGFFSDPDGGPLSYQTKGRPGWLNFTNEKFSGTPSSTNDIGISTVTITATDQFNSSASGTFTITVPNRPPVVAEGLTPQTATVSNLFEYQILDTAFSDPDGGLLSYTATGRPGWLNFSTINNTFSGTPSRGDIGISTVTVTATDQFNSSASGTFTITVPNRPPVVAAGLTSQTATVGNLFEYPIPDGTFSDPDGGRLSYTATGRPEWLSFSTINNTFSGTPTSTNDIGISTVTVTATDENGASVSSSFTITVLNRIPTVNEGLASAMLNLGQSFEYRIPDTAFGDDDIEYGDTLTYTAEGHPREWLSFDIDTFSGTPTSTEDHIGSNIITVTATDKNGASVSSSFTITVLNRIPTVNEGLASAMLNLGQSFEYRIPDTAFGDDDIEYGDTLTYTAEGHPREWLSFDIDTFSGTPTSTEDHIGSNTITVTATDKNGASVSSSFTITVLNRTPTINMGLESAMLNLGQSFVYLIPPDAFSDADIEHGDTLTYTAEGHPREWLSFDIDIFSGMPASTEDHIGISTITVTATDENGASVSSSFTITVLNRTPTVNEGFGSQTVSLGQLFSYPIPSDAFSDADIEHGDTLTYTVIEAPERDWLSFDTDTFLGTPENVGDIGISTITVTATDENGASVSSSFTITVLNRTPTVNEGFGSQTVSLGQLFSYPIPSDAFSDDDIEHGDTLTYTAEGHPTVWLSFDIDTFSGTPTSTEDHIGSNTITVTATDKNGANVSSSFTITVLNRTPTVNMGLASAMLNLGQSFEYRIPDDAFSDDDIEHGDTLTYTAEGHPREWLSFDTDTFLGTPENVGDIGISTITVTATDENGASVSSSFTITVLNRTPTVNMGLESAMLNLGQSFVYLIPPDAFSDADIEHGDTLTYTAEGHPREWLSFDIDTFSGMPASTEDHIGSNTITVTATDKNGANVSSSFTITVLNRTPTVNMGLASAMLNLGQSFEYRIPDDAFSDDDIEYNDTLTYTVIEAPERDWLSFDTDIFLGTPENVGDIGISTITVTATDENGASVSSSFTITVVNQAPTVNEGLASAMLNLGQSFEYRIPDDAFSDDDIEYNDTLTYTVIEAPERDWLSFDIDTFSGTPTSTEDHIGSNTITVTATDENGASVSSSFTITVLNRTPTVNMGLASAMLNLGQSFVYLIPPDAFSDADIEHGDTLTYTAEGHPREWLSFDTDIFLGTPENVGDIGISTITVTATDENGASVSSSFTITVVNQAPTVNEGLASAMLNLGQSFEYRIPDDAFSDDDIEYNDTLTYTVIEAPERDWLSFDTDIFLGTPENVGDIGISTITVTATDENGASVSSSFTITVVNQAPTVNEGLASAMLNLGQSFEYRIPDDAFSDDDIEYNDTLTYTVIEAPERDWLSFDIDTFSGTPTSTEDHIGSNTITVTATDENGASVSSSFTITVVNQAPTVNEGLASAMLNLGQSFEYRIPDTAFGDDDIEYDDTLTYTAEGHPREWLSFDIDTFSGMPASTEDHIGISTITVTATDENGASVSSSFTITVVNQSPTVNMGLESATLNLGQSFVYLIPPEAFSDADIEHGDTLTYTAEGHPREWLSFDIDTFSGMPASTEDHIGISTITVTATDKNGASVSSSFTITVLNRTPTVNMGLESAMLNLGQSFVYLIPPDAFSDADIEHGDTLTYTAEGHPREWLSFDIDTFSGMPASTEDHIGISTITVTATDENGASVSSSFTITVVNQAPTVNMGLESAMLNLGQSFVYLIPPDAFSDADTAYGDMLTYTAEGHPREWLSFDIDTFSGTPTSTEDHIGSNTITVTATDENGASVSSTFTLTVTNPFITIWRTADNESITIPTHSESTYNYSVNWGDSSTSDEWTGDATHRYAVAGDYKVSITGDFPRIYFNGAGDNEKIISIEQWGNIAWSSMESAFEGCTNLRYNNAADPPNLSSVTSTARMFRNADVFNGDIGLWDVSKVTDMSGMFDSAASFDRNLNNWNVGNVTDMSGMFLEADFFNGDIGLWDVSMVTNMSGMFESAFSFDQNLNNWNVGNVTDMSGMFLEADFFNGDIGNWDVSKVTDMSGMFDTAASFNQDLNDWEVSTVTNMAGMFLDAAEFNGNISEWKVGQVTDMSNMFESAVSFNQDLNDWNVVNVTDMSGMFLEAEEFNGDISGWEVDKVTDMSSMFLFATKFNSDISKWKVGQVTDMSGMFDSAASFDQDLTDWDVSQVTDMSNMFFLTDEFNGDISQWDVSQVTDMSGMFFSAIAFNQNLNNWDVSQVTDMEDMFFDVTLSTENYDALLSGWSTIDDDESSLRFSVSFDAGSSRYCNQAARNILTGTYSWMIIDGNRDTAGNCLIPFVANEIADQDILAGTDFSYTFPEDTFNSPSSSILTYTVNKSLPAVWLDFNAGTRTFSGDPPAGDISVITITVTATDANGNSAEDIFTLTTVLNQPPVVAAGFTSQTATVGNFFEYPIPDDAFSDPDIEYGDTLTYTVIEAPERNWLSFDTDTFLGTPENVGDIGISTITVTATDENGASVSSSFTITVLNRPPVVVAERLTSQTATVGDLFEYRIPDATFSDADIEYGDTLTYTVIEAPETDWLGFSTMNNTFSGTPQTEHAGTTVVITVTATDSGGLSVSDSFDLSVLIDNLILKIKVFLEGAQ